MAEITLDEAKKEAASLRTQLNEWADAYYSKDAPEVEDNVYDQSYNRLLELEKEFPEIVTPDSITQRVGGQIDNDFTKVEHPIPMLSMGDVFSKEELKEWAVYDEQSSMFIWERLGCGNYSPTHFGLSLPEVTEVRHNEDGTIVLTIHAVCDSVVCNDAVITHELTMKIQDDGTIQYVGNRILDNGIDNIPRYQYRLGNLQN